MSETLSLTVKLATALSRYTDNRKVIECRLYGNDDLQSVLNNLNDRFPGINTLICKEGLEIVDSINVYVNGDNVRYLKGMKTELKQGDVINIIPAAAAG